MLKICKMTKTYPETKIFQDVNLEIPLKSIVTVTGRNGIGKTTLLNILGGISNFAGDVILTEVSLKNNYKDYIKLTTAIPNVPFLYDYLTVSEMIDLVISLSGVIEITAEEYKNKMIVDLELKDFNSTLIKNLSLGTKQKVAFITAFLNSPKLVLIDEPFVNFDKSSMCKILDFIKSYVLYTGAIVIFSTHSEEKKMNEIVTHNIKINGFKDVVLSKVDGCHEI
ncbi:ATP-binding cassette domain-containing protein [Bacillus cereus group sp. N6]|uniref:ATP-binding cassette domain-containing protein n=1 Tax=Bacillus cereus group sp. N6 TaxID=2794583 RepID=UPI0018F2EEAB|nr:ATP-binding cassette domain-containing protein [Bacillus cereus group sp. N6]MBJ8111715.1 ATP-binding cassette domain-containing protein [Bacillus cereus group sp. N6]